MYEDIEIFGHKVVFLNDGCIKVGCKVINPKLLLDRPTTFYCHCESVETGRILYKVMTGRTMDADDEVHYVRSGAHPSCIGPNGWNPTNCYAGIQEVTPSEFLGLITNKIVIGDLTFEWKDGDLVTDQGTIPATIVEKIRERISARHLRDASGQ